MALVAAATGKNARNLHGDQITFDVGTWPDACDIQLLTELHVARDIVFATTSGVITAVAEGSGSQAGDPDAVRDAPDIVILLGTHLIVIEAKFFGSPKAATLNRQLASQERAIKGLFRVRPSITSWQHLVLLPRQVEGVKSDGTLTWGQVASLSANVLGPDNYVSQRLARAVSYYEAAYPVSQGGTNFAGTMPFEAIKEHCEQYPDIFVGLQGGTKRLQSMTNEEAASRQWKWRREDTPGSADPKNWLAAGVFLNTLKSR